MRLSNDSYSSDRHGIVEVLDNGVWKRICHQHWDDIDSNVTCRELGFKVRIETLKLRQCDGVLDLN